MHVQRCHKLDSMITIGDIYLFQLNTQVGKKNPTQKQWMLDKTKLWI